MYTAATQALVYYINVPFIIIVIRDFAIVFLRDVVNPYNVRSRFTITPSI